MVTAGSELLLLCEIDLVGANLFLAQKVGDLPKWRAN